MMGNCSGCGNDTFIQNKKYNLCGECVFKKGHGGKSKQEVYQERAAKKVKTVHFEGKRVSIPTSYKIVESGIKENNYPTWNHNPDNPKYYHVDEEAQKNITQQNEAERKAKEDIGWREVVIKVNGQEVGKFKTIKLDEELQKDIDQFNNESLKKVWDNEKDESWNNVEGFLKQVRKIDKEEKVKEDLKPHKTFFKGPKKEKKKPKSVNKISGKQSIIERRYRLTCADMDYTTEPVCTGCLKYQGGDIKLSHSHLISRADCHAIGKEDLISERKNITYHCLDFGEHTGCHRKWENPAQRKELLDYEDNIKIIEDLAPEILHKYIV